MRGPGHAIAIRKNVRELRTAPDSLNNVRLGRPGWPGGDPAAPTSHVLSAPQPICGDRMPGRIMPRLSGQNRSGKKFRSQQFAGTPAVRPGNRRESAVKYPLKGHSRFPWGERAESVHRASCAASAALTTRGGASAPPLAVPWPPQAARAFIAFSAVITFGAVSALRNRRFDTFQHRSSHLASSSSPARPRVYSSHSVRISSS